MLVTSDASYSDMIAGPCCGRESKVPKMKANAYSVYKIAMAHLKLKMR
jgi:hypothetical protein